MPEAYKSLVNIIQLYCTDCWKAYKSIYKLDHNYKNKTVKHELSIVNPENSNIHTNSLNLCRAPSKWKDNFYIYWSSLVIARAG